MVKEMRPQDRWNKENGLVSKTYKLQQSIVEDFAEACELAGVSQKKQLETMMLGFINSPRVEPIISREQFEKVQATRKKKPAPPRGYYYDENGDLKVDEKEAEKIQREVKEYVNKKEGRE